MLVVLCFSHPSTSQTADTPASLCQNPNCGRPWVWKLCRLPTSHPTLPLTPLVLVARTPTPIAVKAGNFHLTPPPPTRPPIGAESWGAGRLRAQPGLGRLPSLRKALICTLACYCTASPQPRRRVGLGQSQSPGRSKSPGPPPPPLAASPALPRASARSRRP